MAKTANHKANKVIDIVRQAGVLRPRDLDRYRIPREYLRRQVERGRLARVGRGLYTLPRPRVTEHHTLAEACKLVPQGVVCLMSALRFHGLTTQSPFEVWMAIGHKAWRPKAAGPPLRLVHFSRDAFKQGVEEHRIEGVRVRVYNPAKTVADCFKFRNKIGLDVALEALKDYRRNYPSGNDELWRFARLCRVARVMRPYLEALT